MNLFFSLASWQTIEILAKERRQMFCATMTPMSFKNFGALLSKLRRWEK